MKNKLSKSASKKLSGLGLDDFVLISHAASMTPYSPEYLGLLVRGGKIPGRKFGKNWHISKTFLGEYLKTHRVLVSHGQELLSAGAILPMIGQSSAIGASGTNTIKSEDDSVNSEKKACKNSLSVETRKQLDELEELYKKQAGQKQPGINEKKKSIQAIPPEVHSRAAVSEDKYGFQNLGVKLQSSTNTNVSSLFKMLEAELESGKPNFRRVISGGIERGRTYCGYTVAQWLGIAVISFLAVWFLLGGGF